MADAGSGSAGTATTTITTQEGTGGSVGVGGAAGTGTGVTSSGQTTAQHSGQASTDWTTGFNDETKGYIQNKGFKGPQDVIESYRNFEKTMGSKAEHLLKLPENMDTPEGRAIFERLGAPKEAKDYKIEIPKDHGDEKLADDFRDLAHKNSFTHKQTEALVKWWNERTGGQIKESNDAYKTMLDTANANLKKDWGQAYEQNKEIANQGALALGMGEKETQALGHALGPDKAMMLLHKLGTATGEAKYISGNAAGAGVLAPSAAQSQINELKKDSSFAKRLSTGDADARRQWDKLHQQAYGAAQ